MFLPTALWRDRSKPSNPDVVHIRMFLWQLSPLILPLLTPYPTLYQTAVYKAICPAGTKILPTGESCQFTPGKACLQQGCLTPQTWVWMMAQRSLLQKGYGAINHIAALSNGMKQTLEAANIANGKIPISVIHNGVPERAARPKLATVSSGVVPTAGYAGRLTAEKGIDTLLKAFAQVVKHVPSAQLLIAGQGPLENSLRSLASTLGIEAHVQWLGYLTRAELERAFEQVWVQAVPSLWAEPFGNVTTEAMMRGTAVVASAVGAQPEILGEGGRSGVLVPPGDVPAWAEAMRPILQSCDLAEQMGQQGRQRALAHFSEARCVEQFLALYRDLIQASAPTNTPSKVLATSSSHS